VCVCVCMQAVNRRGRQAVWCGGKVAMWQVKGGVWSRQNRNVRSGILAGSVGLWWQVGHRPSVTRQVVAVAAV